MRRTKAWMLAQSAMIAAAYVVLTYLSGLFGLASGAIQIRLGEALAVLPFFTPAAVPGLFAGCIIANLLTGCAFWDIVFGSAATLAGALICLLLKNRSRLLAPLPNIAANTIVIPLVLKYVYSLGDAYWLLVVTVGVGEIISGGVLGLLLFRAINPVRDRLFGREIIKEQE